MIKLVGLVLFFLLSNVVANRELVGNRHKRSLLQFKNMIECATGRSAFAYNGYGCYCGSGGTGQPADGIDGCCLNHDRCYDRVEAREDCWSPKWRWYSYTCEGRNITCNEEFGSCAYDACMCDREMAQCITQYSYNRQNYNLSPSRCQGEGTPLVGNRKEWCLHYGDINDIQANSGLPRNLASLYSTSTSGQQGSFFAADDDANFVLLHERCLNQSANNLGLQPALLAALASRSSMGGRMLELSGYNTQFPHLWGLVGCDTRIHRNACVGSSLSDCNAIETAVRLQLLNPIQLRLDDYRPQSSSESEYKQFLNRVLKAALNNYLSGNGNEKLNFADDVVNRAKRYNSYQLWRCAGDSRYVSNYETDLTPYSRSQCTQYIETGNCSFYATCIENRLQCGGRGFAITRGANFCYRYREYYNNFTEAGKQWILSTQRCLMTKMRTFLERNTMTCETLHDLSNRAEITCMKESGFCRMISDNLHILREVYDGVLIATRSILFGWIPASSVGDLTFDIAAHRFVDQPYENMARRQEKFIWDLVYDMIVSCKYNCETTVDGTECGPWYRDAWHYIRSSSLFTVLRQRRKRSVQDCSNLAATKDCQFWKCIDEEYGCTSQHGGNSMVRDFRLPFCYRQETVSDTQTHSLLDQTERCVINKIVQAATNQENECVDIEFEIVSSQAQCLKETGFCEATRAIEWALNRLANVKTFPSTMPREFGKFTTDGKLELLSTTYFRWLQFFKQQIGDAQSRVCSSRATELYELRFNNQMQTMVKYRIEL